MIDRKRPFFTRPAEWARTINGPKAEATFQKEDKNKPRYAKNNPRYAIYSQSLRKK